jgi:hypothetical protein
MGRMFNERAAQLFGTQAVPVVGTEGGIYAFRGQVYQQDNRYPPYNEQSHAQATVAMFEWIAREAPPWFFGVTLWKEDEYYIPSTVPAIGHLSEIAPILKDVPPIDVLGPGIPPALATPTPPGPGPIRGQADFHMLLLGPGLDSSWFFDTSRAYWNTFRPMVTTSVDLIDLIPSTQSLAVTVIATPDLVETLRQAITGRYPNVWFDVIEADNLEEVATTLNNRVQVNRRFG